MVLMLRQARTLPESENFHACRHALRRFQSTRRPPFLRQSIVTRFGAVRLKWCVLLTLPALAGADNTDNLLKTIETRYNRSQSLKLDFSETYIGTGRPAQRESGVLYLRKPGRMRWEYSSPAGKIFLSDGKEVFQYTPGDAQAARAKLKQSEDMRAPLAFLLGKLDFAKEFKAFQTNADPAGTWIAAEPKSDNLAYSKVEFLASSDGEIHRVRITGQDSSKLDFTFSNEQLNAPVAPSMFTFLPPAGVRVVEAAQ
jgi:outer membrane lipoprotein carrier protein